MWTLVVVNGEPIVGQQLHLLDRLEQIRIENLAAIGSIEALDEGVLVRLARRDIQSGNPALLAPNKPFSARYPTMRTRTSR